MQSKYIKIKASLFPSEYFETKTITFKSRDNKDVPITIIHKKGMKLDGNNPTLLTAYGGYGTVSRANFSSGMVYFLEKGGVFDEVFSTTSSTKVFHCWHDGHLPSHFADSKPQL